MSIMQRLTLIGLNKFDPTLFDTLELPTGYNKETFINSLLLEHGEKPVLYPNPDFMKFSIGAWGQKWKLELERIYEALSATYDPIYNYDRYEEYTDTENKTGSGTDSKTGSGSDSRNTSSESDTTTSSSTTQEATTEHKVSAYNSSDYSPESIDESDGNASTSGRDNNETSTSESGSYNTSENGSYTNKDDRELKHTAHLYGNIGVTTSASMVTEIVHQRTQYNLYDIACRLFANELLLSIY